LINTVFGDFLQQSEMIFEVYENKKQKEWTWELRFRNRVLIAKGDRGYRDYEELRGLIQSIKEQAKDAPIAII
jgi:uncharacterized protein YegP (UPF0339 family)